MIVAVTGHRPERFGDDSACMGVRCALWATLSSLDPDKLLTGGARGVDLWAAQWATHYADEIGTPFVVALPFIGHTALWSQRDVEEYDRTMKDGYKSGTLSRIEFLGSSSRKSAAYFKRNRYLVDNCDLLVAVYDGKPGGGTAYTVEYARKVGREIRMVKW